MHLPRLSLVHGPQSPGVGGEGTGGMNRGEGYKNTGGMYIGAKGGSNQFEGRGGGGLCVTRKSRHTIRHEAAKQQPAEPAHTMSYIQ